MDSCNKKTKIKGIYLQEMKDGLPVGDLFKIDPNKENTGITFNLRDDNRPYWELLGYKTEQDYWRNVKITIS